MPHWLLVAIVAVIAVVRPLLMDPLVVFAWRAGSASFNWHRYRVSNGQSRITFGGWPAWRKRAAGGELEQAAWRSSEAPPQTDESVSPALAHGVGDFPNPRIERGTVDIAFGIDLCDAIDHDVAT